MEKKNRIKFFLHYEQNFNFIFIIVVEIILLIYSFVNENIDETFFRIINLIIEYKYYINQFIIPSN